MGTGVDDRHPETPQQRRLRAVVIGTAVGLGLAVAAVAVVFAVVAIPIYLVGSDDGGLDRDLVRIGLFGVAVPVGSLVGVVAGWLVARWYVRGAHLPDSANR
jgi:hypothetical protein